MITQILKADYTDYLWFIWITLFLIIVPFSFAEQELYTLEPIVVTARADALKGNYAAEILSAQDLQDKGLNTIADIFEYASGVDLRYRGQFAVQGDLSLRGSTYEQVALLIDGVRINDPQTGHHNLDIPLTVFDVERVEIFKEGLSSQFGSGALGGAVNIITKKPTRKILNAEILFGEHALSGQAISLSFPKDNFSGRFSFEHKISNGGRPNTDFEYRTASFYLGKEYDLFTLDSLFGYQKKDFGASSFYSNLFPQEEEHTETLFFRSGLDATSIVGTPTLDIFLRKHRDKFILDRNNPIFVNYHTTYGYGLNSQANLPIQWGDFLLGFDLAEDEINSTKLGKHSRLNLAPSIAFTAELSSKFSADLRMRFDHYHNLSWQESYNAAIAYNINDGLKLKGSLGRAFRIPSFTELYYSDPGNIGNSYLGVEKSDNFRLGLDFENEFIGLGLEGFYRKGRNLIDWIRTSTLNPWQATNLGRVDFRGVDFQLKLKPGQIWEEPKLPEVSFFYTYTNVDKKAGGFLSKYALDVLKHQFITAIDYSFLGMNSALRLSYNDRYYAKSYFLVSLYLSKKLAKEGYSIEPFLKIDNLTNTKYSEVGGVLQPGRWIQAGLKFEW